MRTHDFQNPNQQSEKQKQKSVSTSSFYRQTIPKPTPKNSPQLSHAIESQQREAEQSIQKLKLILDNKSQYVSKRMQESNQQNKLVGNQLVIVEKGMGESTKSVHRNDKTKEWASQMEKTIQSIVSTHKESNAKLVGRLINQYKAIQNTCLQIEEKRREQKKQRQKQWQQVIDNIGETIIQAETVIECEREEMQATMNKLQRDILDMEQESSTLLQMQKNSRKQQHEYLTKLIQKIMDKLIY